MGVSVQFEPLYGVNSAGRALCSVLTIDGFKILLDCGWTSAFDVPYVSALAERAKTVDVVLLSHPDIPHLGALPYMVGRCGLSAPIISTLPVWRMGQMFMYDAYQSLVAKRHFDLFNLDDVDAAFDMSQENSNRYSLIKYQQHFPLDAISGGTGIIVTPYPAGHMLGGTVWNIKKGTESIVYAVDFNHRRERHLKPISFTSFSRPSHLILGASQILTKLGAKNSTDIATHISQVVQSNGNVLIPVDTAGRVIELAIQLSDQWVSDPQLATAKLVVLNEFALRTFEFARSMIEWMSDEVVKRFDVSRDNLFDFKKKTIMMCQTKAELDRIQGPKVVLASSPSLDYGFSRDVFLEWCGDPRNAVILVDVPEVGTLYASLYGHVNKNPEDKTGRPWTLSVKVEAKVQLSGDELRAWREQEKARQLQIEEDARREEEERKAQQIQKELEMRDIDEDVIMSKAAREPTGDGISPSETVPVNSTAVSPTPSSPESVSDYDEKTEEALSAYLAQVDDFSWVRNAAERVIHRNITEKPKWDDYGQVIDTTRFMIGEDPGEGAPEQGVDYGVKPEGNAEEMEEDQEIIPTKYVESILNLQVACKLLYVDYAGLSDGDSVKRLVKKVEPRCVVLIRGTREETEHMRTFLIDSVFSGQLEDRTKAHDDVVCPGLGEVVDITSNIPVQDLVMKESLVRQLEWSQLSGNAISHLDAVLVRNEETGDYMLDNLSAVTEASESKAITSNLPATKSEKHIPDGMKVADGKDAMSDISLSGHPTVFIGTIMLNRLRDALAKHGLSAEFLGGTLCVENTETGAVILVKKVSAQNIVLDGALCEEMFIVRDILYRELIIPT